MAEEHHQGAAYLLALKQSSGPRGVEPEPREAPGKPFQSRDKRQAPRWKCEGSVEIREEGCEVRTWATFTDISLNGCYIEAQATFPAGTVLNLKLESNGIQVETRGNVRVNYPYLGMGVAFVGMTEENVARMRRILADASRSSVVPRPGFAFTAEQTKALGSMPETADSAALMKKMMEFFESHEVLRREDFAQLLRQWQDKK